MNITIISRQVSTKVYHITGEDEASARSQFERLKDGQEDPDDELADGEYIVDIRIGNNGLFGGLVFDSTPFDGAK